MAVRRATHALETLHENPSTSFFCKQPGLQSGIWRQLFITSLSKSRSQQHDTARGATRAWFSLLVIPSLPITALQSFWGLCKMRTGQGGGTERAWERISYRRKKFVQIISYHLSYRLKRKNCRVWWDLLGFSLLFFLLCSCLSFPSFFVG